MDTNMSLSNLLRKLADILDAKQHTDELDKDLSFIGPSQTELELKKKEAGVSSAYDNTDELEELKRLSGCSGE